VTSPDGPQQSIASTDEKISNMSKCAGGRLAIESNLTPLARAPFSRNRLAEWQQASVETPC